MPAHKNNKTNLWFVRFRIKDFTGKPVAIYKTGFKTKHEAVDWEEKRKKFAENNSEINFEDFVKEIYFKNLKTKVRESTYYCYCKIINSRIIPYFKNYSISEITPSMILEWQNMMLNKIGIHKKTMKTSYLRNCHKNLTSIFSHAVRFYKLEKNPASIAGNFTETEKSDMKFWTLDEYRKFEKAVKSEPKFFYAFEILYWCGLRCGEMLALTVKDFDFKNKTLNVNKTYYKRGGIEYITSPKTKQGIRKVSMPDFLCQEIKEYIDKNFESDYDGRIFFFSNASIKNALCRNAKEAKVQIIRVHDLRHSHVSLLIQQGYSAVAIANRVGHKSIDITYRYAHMFPTVQNDIAASLNELGNVKTEV